LRIPKKIAKKLKISSWFHFKPKQVGQAKKGGKNFSCSEPFLPVTSKRISKKNSKKIYKIKKQNPSFISSQNRVGPAEKERKKFSHSERFTQPELENSQKNSKKNSKN